MSNGRERILEAALELFDRRGYGATALSDVRRAAGVSNGSLYHHFAGREQLAAALLLDGLTRYQHGFRTLLGRPSAEAVIRAGVAYHLRFGVRHRALARFLLAPIEPEVLSAAGAALARQNREFLGEVSDWYEGEVAAGELRAVEPALRYPLWLGASQETARTWLADYGPSPSRYSGQLAAAAWRALGP